MGKVKMSKKSTHIDMTAMCDVAFLLLTFFILTSTAKVPDALPVDIPQSTVQSKLNDKDLAIISIGSKEGKDRVFYGLKDRDVRYRTLELMADKYGISFTDQEKKEFSLMENFGVPIESMKQLLALKSSDRIKEGVQAGIPTDSINNQLKDWIYTSRQANIERTQNEVKFAIKGDAKEQYPQIKKVMDILQDQKINTFNLVTNLRGKE